MNSSSDSLLKQAQTAIDREDWALAGQFLQQLLFQEAIPSPQQLEDACSLALQLLEEGDFQDRWDVAKLFSGMGNRAIMPLMTLLQNEDADAEVRWFAARILGEFRDRSVLAALVDLIETSNHTDLINMATTSLAGFGEMAIDSLVGLLAHDETRPFAVKGLAQIRSSRAIDPLLQVSQDADPIVRKEAIEALSPFQDPRISAVLQRALQDPNTAVRRVAVSGLSSRSHQSEAIQLVPILAPLLHDFNLEICQQTAIALGRIGSASAAAALFQVWQSPHTPTPLQVEIIRALGWMGTPIALDYLQKAIATDDTRSANPEVLQEIIVALGRTESAVLKSQAAQTLVTLLQADRLAQTNPSLKQQIASELGQLGSSIALNALIDLLADSDAGVRLHAIAALKKLDPFTAHQRLEELNQKADLDRELRQGVAIALQEW